MSAFLAFEREVSINMGGMLNSSVFGELPGFGGGSLAQEEGARRPVIAVSGERWPVGRKEELVVQGGNCEGLFLY